jgi:small subunit ribosomal protein MRP21
MSSRSLGELLLRPSPLTRTPLCPPAGIRRIAPAWAARRCIANSPSQPAAQPQPKDDDYGYEPSPQQARQPSLDFPRPRRPTNNETSHAIDSLFSGLPRSQAPQPRQSTSGDEVRAARANHVFGSEFSSPSSRPSRAPPRLNFDDMSLPSDMLDPNLSNKPSDAANLATQQAETFANYPRLNPTYGRAVELDASKGRDIVRGIGMLGSLMARNKVRHDMMKQRFHERGGLKRKRLASERWRARFKTGFRDLTARVSELTRKGW